MPLLLVLAQAAVVQFHVRVTPDTVFVGQQAMYEASTYVNSAARATLRATPEYTPPDIRGVTAYDFPFNAGSVSQTMLGGTQFRQYLFRRALFPLTPGRVAIPSATLTYSLPASDSYLGTAETYTLSSEPTTLLVRPLPDAGQPVNFGGAVGTYQVTANVDDTALRAGHPFTLTLRVAGDGDVNLLPRPPLVLDWASTVPAAERVTWDSTANVMRGTKEFDWVVTPRTPGSHVLDTIRYPYFDPRTATYVVAKAPPLVLHITNDATSASPPDEADPPADTIGDTPFPALARTGRAHPLLVALLGALIVAAAGALLYLIRRDAVDDEAT